MRPKRRGHCERQGVLGLTEDEEVCVGNGVKSQASFLILSSFLSNCCCVFSDHFYFFFCDSVLRSVLQRRERCHLLRDSGPVDSQNPILSCNRSKLFL